MSETAAATETDSVAENCKTVSREWLHPERRAVSRFAERDSTVTSRLLNCFAKLSPRGENVWITCLGIARLCAVILLAWRKKYVVKLTL